MKVSSFEELKKVVNKKDMQNIMLGFMMESMACVKVVDNIEKELETKDDNDTVSVAKIKELMTLDEDGEWFV